MRTIAGETPLIPGIVAERVTAEPDWQDYLCRRADYHYNHTPHFRRKMHRQDCREWLEAFMTHWFNGGNKAAQIARERWEKAVEE